MSERAEAVNATGAAHVAEAAQRVGRGCYTSPPISCLTGAGDIPTVRQDRAEPLGVYGRTKLAGEREVLPDLRRARTGGSHGLAVCVARAEFPANDAATHARAGAGRCGRRPGRDSNLGARAVGGPVGAAARPELSGLHHWTEAGVASWYDFAVAIQEEALVQGLLDRAVPIRPLRTDEYPTPARRPPTVYWTRA